MQKLPRKKEGSMKNQSRETFLTVTNGANERWLLLLAIHPSDNVGSGFLKAKAFVSTNKYKSAFAHATRRDFLSLSKHPKSFAHLQRISHCGKIGFRYKTPARLKPRSTTVLRVFVLFVCLFLEAWPGVHPRREAAHVLRHPALVGFGGGHQLAASQLVRVSRASAAAMVGRRALVRRRRWRQDAGVATLALEAPVRRCSVMSSSIRHVSGPSDQTIFWGGGGV